MPLTAPNPFDVLQRQQPNPVLPQTLTPPRVEAQPHRSTDPVGKWGRDAAAGIHEIADKPFVSKFGGVPVEEPTGFVSKFGGVPVEEAEPVDDEKTWAQSFDELATGVRNGLANVIFEAPAMAQGLPVVGQVGAAQEALFRHVAAKYFDDRNVNLKDVARKWLDEKGITNTGLDTIEARIGEEALNGLLFLAALRSGAPTLAAKQGAKWWPTIQRELGQFLIKRPWAAVGTELSAAGGTVVGREKLKEHGPVAEALGGLAGGMAGGMGLTAGASVLSHGGRALAGGVRKTVEPLTNAVAPSTNAAVMQWLENAGVLRPKPPLQGEAIRPPTADPRQAKQFAESQIAGDRLMMEEEIIKSIADIPVSATPQEANMALRQGLFRAEEISQRVVSDAWQATDLSLPVPIAPIQARASALAREFADRPTALPEQFIRYLMPDDEGAYRGMRFEGKWLPPLTDTPSIQRLRDFKGILFRARRTEQARAFRGEGVNEALARNYLMLEKIIDDAIGEAHPRNVGLRQARELSRQHHELFDPEAIKSILASRATGQPKVHPHETVDELIQTYPGIENALRIRSTLRSGPFSSTFRGRPGYVTVAERQELDALQGQIEDAVLAEIKDVGQFDDPKKAARMMRSLMPKVRSHAGLLARIQHHLGRYDAAEQRLKLINSSALEKFSTKDPVVAVKGLFSAANPEHDARQLVATFHNHDAALQGFRASVVDEFVSRTSFEPLKMEKLINQPQTNRMLRASLGSDLFDRLDKNVKIAAGIARGDDMTLRKMLLPTGSIAARVLGAAYGRNMSQTLGGGTVQVPGIFSEQFRRAFERVFRSVAPEDLFKRAVFDPKWEQLLRAREPRNTKELRQMYGRMRRILIGIEGGRQAVMPGEEE